MPEQKKKKILIAEDEQAMASVLIHKCNAVGIQTLHVSTGDQVIPNLQKEHFDLVLLDIMMPEMNGFQVLERMNEQNIRTPVILLSNLGQNEDVLKGKALGAQGYLIKSAVTPAEILDFVQRLFEKTGP